VVLPHIRAFQKTPNPQTFEAVHAAADDFLDQENFAAAEACYRTLLEAVSNDPGIRERLSASLRGAGKLTDAAAELHTAITDLRAHDEGSEEDQSWLYLDLGSILEEIAPVPGTGPEWPCRDAQGTKLFTVDLQTNNTQGETPLMLSAEECYRRAISLSPHLGEPHKRLADWLVMFPDNAAAAATHFAAAASLMPDDICAITHHLHGAPAARKVSPLPIAPIGTPGAAAPGTDGSSAVGLHTLFRDAPPDLSADLSEHADWVVGTSASFETHGCVVLPGFLGGTEIDALAHCVRDAVDSTNDEGVGDFAHETRAAEHRVHKALTVHAARRPLNSVLAKLQPLLSRLLQAEQSGKEPLDKEPLGKEPLVKGPLDTEQLMPLVGCGFMRILPGAQVQSVVYPQYYPYQCSSHSR
jgi:tetratricopeptide (TPR) repeat protein